MSTFLDENLFKRATASSTLPVDRRLACKHLLHSLRCRCQVFRAEPGFDGLELFRFTVFGKRCQGLRNSTVLPIIIIRPREKCLSIFHGRLFWRHGQGLLKLCNTDQTMDKGLQDDMAPDIQAHWTDQQPCN